MLPLPSNKQFYIVIWVKLVSSQSRYVLVLLTYMADDLLPMLAKKLQLSKVTFIMSSKYKITPSLSFIARLYSKEVFEIVSDILSDRK